MQFRVRLDLPQDFDSANAGHPQVEQHHILLAGLPGRAGAAAEEKVEHRLTRAEVLDPAARRAHRQILADQERVTLSLIHI